MLVRPAVVLFVLLAIASGPMVSDEWDQWEVGVAAYRAEDYETSVEEFAKWVVRHPEYSGAHFMLGQSLLAAGNRHGAVESLRTAYDLEPENVRAQIALAAALIATEQHDEAAALLGRVDILGMPLSQQAHVHELRAEALSENEDFKTTLRAPASAVDENPSDTDALYRYGVMLSDTGQTKLALDVFRRVVSLDRSYHNLIRLGEAQLAAKQHRRGIATFEQAGAKERESGCLATTSVWLTLPAATTTPR